MIKVLADKYLFELEGLLPAGAALERFDPQRGLPGGELDYDAFLTRTVIPVNRETVDAFTDRLSFVGSGSSGTDHVDLPLLESRGIVFADAAGCNARSVAEYVATGLVWWAEEQGAALEDLQMGILGAGHTGRALRELADRCGVRGVRTCDPPRALREPAFESCTREELLECDVISLHVPLTGAGEHPTRHWLDRPALRQSRARLIVNASRGGVVNESALLDWLREEEGRRCIIDTWEEEPRFRDETLHAAFLATPHIAGYSLQAKREASRRIARALRRHFGLEGRTYGPERSENARKKSREPANAGPAIVPGTPSSPGEVLQQLHPAREYEKNLKKLAGLSAAKKAEEFGRLRSAFPLRNEFPSMALDDALHRRFPLLQRLGFSRTSS